MGQSSLPVYAAISKAFRSGQPLTANDYGAFVAASSKELAAHRSGEAFAMAVGEQYAAEKISPAAILVEIENGEFGKRLQRIATAHDAPAQAPAQTVAEPQLQAQLAPVEKPILGKYTAMDAQRKMTHGAPSRAQGA